MSKEMKYSGIEWIGDIPKNWEVRNLGNLSNLYTGNSIKDNEKDNYTDNFKSIPYIATKDINNNHTINYKNGMYVKEDDLSFKIALKDSTLICIEGGSAGAKIAYLNQDVTFGNKLCAVYSESVSNEYLYYYILSPCFNNSFNSRITGLIPGVTLSEMSKIEVVIPPPTKQYKIVKVLDEKVTKIAALQSETQQSIEELKKYKQSLITEAVTKGLDPTVEIKDSGIEWIGNIPSNWNVRKIKHEFSLKGRIGWQGLTSKEHQDKGPHLITGTDFKNGIIDWDSCVRISEERFKEAPEIHIKENDLLITKDGTIGKVALAINVPKNVSLNSGVLLIREKSNSSINKKFMYYNLLSNMFWNWYNSNDQGSSTIRHLYQGQFYNYSYAQPPLNEQQQIVEYLDDKVTTIDRLIEDKTKIIKEFENYKTSLIYEYVTGKKEV